MNRWRPNEHVEQSKFSSIGFPDAYTKVAAEVHVHQCSPDDWKHVQWSLAGSVFVIRLFWKTSSWIIEETKLALDNSELPTLYKIFQSCMPLQPQRSSQVQTFCCNFSHGDHHCLHHQHDQHVWETRLDCKSKPLRITIFFTWGCRPSCRHTARYLSWPVAAVQRDSTLKWAKSLGVEKGLQQFHSHRLRPQFNKLPKAQGIQGLLLTPK